MPGWYIHLQIAKKLAEKLKECGESGAELEKEGIASFTEKGIAPAELARIVKKYPNYYALGAIGPDIFVFLPDFKNTYVRNFVEIAYWIIDLYDQLDEKFIKPWENEMGPIEEDTSELVSRLTGGLSDDIARIMNDMSAVFITAIEDYATRIYDWWGIFGCGPSTAYDDQLFFWSDMFHYRWTNEFARTLFTVARDSVLNPKNKWVPKDQKETYGWEAGIAFALGWMTHIGTDVSGHPYVNEKTGGPFRLHWGRHHLVENHMDAFVCDALHGGDENYNAIPCSAQHFWIQFGDDPEHTPEHDYFGDFPEYPTGLTLRDCYDRSNIFDVDSKMPVELSQLLREAMERVFYKNHTPETNDGGATHPTILAQDVPPSSDPESSPADGRPTVDQLHDMYNVMFKYLKYVTTDYYKIPKPQMPDVFPNLDPPVAPGSDDAPGEDEDNWDFWDWLLAIFAWILYVIEWIAYVVTVLPAIIADLATYPARCALYPLEEAVYELWKALRYLLVMEGYVAPMPDEIDLGLVQLGMPSEGPYLGLLAQVNDVFGGWLGDDPNPAQGSETVGGREYPRDTVVDDPTYVQQFVQDLSPSTLQPSDPRVPSEFLRPWEYPYYNNQGEAVGLEAGATRASPYPKDAVPTILLGRMKGSDASRTAYEKAETPSDTDRLNLHLNAELNLGDAFYYSLYVLGQLTRMSDPQDSEWKCFNLDGDRGYGYKCWDFDRRYDRLDPGTRKPVLVKYDSTEYPLACTPPRAFISGATELPSVPSTVPTDYKPGVPLKTHYLKKLKKGDPGFPKCTIEKKSES